MDAGHRAVIFDRYRGVLDIVKNEGTHFKIPFFQVRSRRGGRCGAQASRVPPVVGQRAPAVPRAV